MTRALALGLLLCAAGAQGGQEEASPGEKRAGLAILGSLLYTNAEMTWEGHGWLALSADAAFALMLTRILGDSPGKRERAYNDKFAMALFAYSAGVFLAYPFYTVFKGQADQDGSRVAAGMLGLASLVLPVMLSKPDPAPPKRRFEPVLKQKDLGSLNLEPFHDGALLVYRKGWSFP